MNLAEFYVDHEKCTGCGKCALVCPGGLIHLDDRKTVQICPVVEFGWNGCWKCQHCLAVCPAGAISVLGCSPEDSLPPPNHESAYQMLKAIVTSRHSCRRYKSENVDQQIIRELVDLLPCAPNGGNKQQVEFTLIDDKEQMNIFRRPAYGEMERLAEHGIFPEGFDKVSYSQMKGWGKTVRPDMLFCGAPHLLIPHAPLGKGTPQQDVAVAGAYFELLCAARGLGSVMMTFPLDALRRMPDVMALLNIPEDHYIGMLIGFGYPQIRYARGVQKTVAESRIHRLSFERESV